ncbi:hypothetical protein F66182_1980 [Fusarium sp. NRRL 66182]|nr:hypothetical protein F66182_1980 [Fusarium sp. NRRL 66182]
MSDQEYRHPRYQRPRREPQNPFVDSMFNGTPRAVNGLAEPDYDDHVFHMGEPFDLPIRPQPAQRPPPNAAPRRPSQILDGGQNTIIVLLSDLEPRAGRYGQAGERFSMDQNTLFTLLPRARYAVRKSTLKLETFFLPQDMEPHPPQMIHRALQFLFRHLEAYSRTGSLDMFGAASREIEDDPTRGRAVTRWAAMVHALCVILDNDRGLGCSEGLLGGILDFFEKLIRHVHDILGWDETSILFEAFAAIFRTEQRNMVHQVRRIWNRFDAEVREQLLGDMRRALPAEGIDGMAHRMYRTLGY